MFKTHELCPTLLAALVGLTLLSCGGGGSSAPPSPQPPASSSNAPPRNVTEPEKREAIEHELRLKAEEHLDQQKSATGLWQFTALCLSAAATILLLVGTSIGARARHEAEKT